MRLEVDVHAAERRGPIVSRDPASGFRLQAVDAGALIWVSVEILAHPTDVQSGVRGTIDTDALGAALGVPADRLLADHWFVAGAAAGPALECLRKVGLVTDTGAAVHVTLPDGVVAMGELTFTGDGGARLALDVFSQSGTSVFARSSRPHFWIAARSILPVPSLVDETKAIMAAIASTMSTRGWGFDAVCKATTHYVGSSAAEDLHENMKVRNAYYRRPGPASTGLPVAAFPLSSSKIAVDLLGVIR
jgi:hypothetical protein